MPARQPLLARPSPWKWPFFLAFVSQASLTRRHDAARSLTRIWKVKEPRDPCRAKPASQHEPPAAGRPHTPAGHQLPAGTLLGDTDSVRVQHDVRARLSGLHRNRGPAAPKSVPASSSRGRPHTRGPARGGWGDEGSSRWRHPYMMEWFQNTQTGLVRSSVSSRTCSTRTGLSRGLGRAAPSLYTTALTTGVLMTGRLGSLGRRCENTGKGTVRSHLSQICASTTPEARTVDVSPRGPEPEPQPLCSRLCERWGVCGALVTSGWAAAPRKGHLDAQNLILGALGAVVCGRGPGSRRNVLARMPGEALWNPPETGLTGDCGGQGRSAQAGAGLGSGR